MRLQYSIWNQHGSDLGTCFVSDAIDRCLSDVEKYHAVVLVPLLISTSFAIVDTPNP